MNTEDGAIARIAARLLERPDPLEPLAGLTPDWQPEEPFSSPPVPAAVLIALVVRGTEYTVLYTQRGSRLRAHSGQVAFPGGKADPGDTSPAATAFREAAEEVGLLADDAEVLGYLPNYFTGTNYLITPVVALVRPSMPFRPNPDEVDCVFEVPLEIIARSGNYGRYVVDAAGRQGSTWQLDHEGRTIWGITANLTRRFRDLALQDFGVEP